MFLCNLLYITGILVILFAITCYKYHSIKEEFMQGLWYNDEEKLYLFISSKKKNGKIGGYIIKDKPASTTELDSNEPFEMDLKIGILNTVHMTTYKTKTLQKELSIQINIAKGIIRLPLKSNKVITLYKDTYTSNNI